MFRNKHHDFWRRIAIRLALVFAALGGVSVGAAPVAAPSAFGTFMATATGTGQYTVGFGSGGVPMAAPSVPTIHTAGATPIATFTGMFPAASGRIPITATSTISGAQASAAIGRFLGRSLPVLATGVALYDLAKELGFTLGTDASGNQTISKSDPGACTVAPCFKYGFPATGYGPGTGNIFPDQEAACQFGMTYKTAGGWDNMQSQGSTCNARAANGYVLSTFFLTSLSVSPTTPSTPIVNPAVNQEFLDAIAAKSGWPAGSRISQALADAAAAEEAQATTAKPAVKIQPSAPTITGPATGTPSTSTSTKPSVTGTGTDTENKTCTPQYVYSLAVITTKEACVTTLTKPDGTTTTTSTTTAPVAEKPVAEPETDLCEKNPDILACQKLDEETGEIPKDEKTITYSEEAVFGTGSCPANLTANIATLGGSFTVWDWQKTCEMALPLRAIVLALASFAAFLIVMPGDNRT
jgi:hypothetical protein